MGISKEPKSTTPPSAVIPIEEMTSPADNVLLSQPYTQDTVSVTQDTVSVAQTLNLNPTADHSSLAGQMPDGSKLPRSMSNNRI